MAASLPASSRSARDIARDNAFVLFAMILISFSYPLGEEIAPSLDPAVMMLIRFGLATLAFTPYIALRYGLRWPGLGALGRYATISATLAIFFWTMFEALRYTTALNVSVITTTIPGFTAVFGALVVGERLGPHRLAALCLAMAGAVWVIFRGDPERLLALELNKGDVIVLAGCVVMGLYSPLIKRFHRGEPVPIMTFWILGCAALWYLLISNVKLATTDWGSLPPIVYWGVGYIALGPTVFSFFLIQRTTITLGPTRVQSYSCMLPLFVVLIDWAIGKGWPSLMTVPGVAIVVIASVVIQRGAIVEGRAAPQA